MKNENLILAALSGILAFGSVHANEQHKADDPAKVKCEGVNSCKGKSDCHTKTNTCSGANSCKGKGWVQMTKAECDKAKEKLKTEVKAKKHG